MNLKLALAFACLMPLACAAVAAPAAWKPMLSDDKKCEAMVPGNWTPAVTGVGMKIPGGRSSASVVLDDDRNLADKKAAMAFLYHVTKTFEDSVGRYWVETAGSADGMRQWIVAAPATGGVCTGLIRFDKMVSEADAKHIATSVKKH